MKIPKTFSRKSVARKSKELSIEEIRAKANRLSCYRKKYSFLCKQKFSTNCSEKYQLISRELRELDILKLEGVWAWKDEHVGIKPVIWGQG